MATGTLGTNATTSLTSLKISSAMAPADIATIQAAILKDNQPANNTIPPQNPGSFSVSGLKLALPGGRGVIVCKPGDYIAIDPVTGWPIVLSANAVANGAFTHTN